MAGLALISPHLDDAVFACGELLAAHPGARVITLFAGIPHAAAPLPEWDAACGFAAAREAMAARRREDEAALALLGAKPRWLDFLDAQYAPSPSLQELAPPLAQALGEAGCDRVAAPLGLFHSDHKLASAAALALARSDRREWLLYEDALYRRIPHAVDERLAALGAAGVRARRVAGREPGTESGTYTEKKRGAIACYASQLRGLATPGRPGHADLDAEERYWKISFESGLARRPHAQPA